MTKKKGGKKPAKKELKAPAEKGAKLAAVSDIHIA